MYKIISYLMALNTKFSYLVNLDPIKEPAKINIYSPSISISNLTDNVKNELDGYDMKYNVSNDSNYENELFAINKYRNQFELLKILEQKTINNISKMDYIEKYNYLFNSSKGINLYGGGLMSEFDCTFFEGF